MINYRISTQYTDAPGPRYKRQGDYSGEEFRETVLIPMYKNAINAGEQITIDLDGAFGYPTSFLEEAFGGLAREYGIKEVQRMFVFVCSDEPSLIEEIQDDIIHAKDKKK